MTEDKAIPYAVAHQVISAIQEVVCIPERYWEKTPPLVGDTFKLRGTGQTPIPQPSTWEVVGEAMALDAKVKGCVAFFRKLWPFKDDWIKPDDRIYCFPARLTSERPPRIELMNWLDQELSKRAKA